MTLLQAIRAVLAGTAVAGVAGGLFGVILARAAPGFFSGFGGQDHGDMDAVETGLALGAIGGLVLGSTGCVVLAAVKMWVDARGAPAPAADLEE